MKNSFFGTFPATIRLFILITLITFSTYVLNYYTFKVSFFLFLFSLVIVLADKRRSLKLVVIAILPTTWFFFGNLFLSPCNINAGGMAFLLTIGRRSTMICINETGLKLGLNSFFIRTSQFLIGYAWLISTKFSEIYESFAIFKIFIPRHKRNSLKLLCLIIFKALEDLRNKFVIAYRALKVKGLKVSRPWQFETLILILISMLKISVSNLIRSINDYVYLYLIHSKIKRSEFLQLMDYSIEIDQITVLKNNEIILENISLRIQKGEFVTIVGNDCSGKTSLLKFISGYIPYINREVYSLIGDIAIFDLNPSSPLFFETLLSNITLVSNELTSNFIGLTIKQQILCITNNEIKAKTLLARFNIGYLWNNEINSISGGESVKLMVICSILRQTDIYLFDDLLTQLDDESKIILIDELKKLKQNGKTIIICDKDISSFNTLTDKKVYLEDGKIVNYKNEKSLFEVSTDKIKNDTSFIKLPIVKIKNLTVRFDSIELIKNLNFEIKKSEYYVITGKNGAGKSSLANAISGLLKPYKGAIEKVHGIRIGYIFQNPLLQIIEKKAAEELSFGPYKRKLMPSETNDYIKEALFFSMLKPEDSTIDIHNSNATLLEIAYTLKTYDLIVLDEPTVNLDNENKNKIIKFIEAGLANNISFIIITHDDFIKTKSENTYILQEKTLMTL